MHHILPLQSSFVFVEKVNVNDHCMPLYVIKKKAKTHERLTS